MNTTIWIVLGILVLVLIVLAAMALMRRSKAQGAHAPETTRSGSSRAAAGAGAAGAGAAGAAALGRDDKDTTAAPEGQHADPTGRHDDAPGAYATGNDGQDRAGSTRPDAARDGGAEYPSEDPSEARTEAVPTLDENSDAQYFGEDDVRAPHQDGGADADTRADETLAAREESLPSTVDTTDEPARDAAGATVGEGDLPGAYPADDETHQTQESGDLRGGTAATSAERTADGAPVDEQDDRGPGAGVAAAGAVGVTGAAAGAYAVSNRSDDDQPDRTSGTGRHAATDSALGEDTERRPGMIAPADEARDGAPGVDDSGREGDSLLRDDSSIERDGLSGDGQFGDSARQVDGPRHAASEGLSPTDGGATEARAGRHLADDDGRADQDAMTAGPSGDLPQRRDGLDGAESTDNTEFASGARSTQDGEGRHRAASGLAPEPASPAEEDPARPGDAGSPSSRFGESDATGRAEVPAPLGDSDEAQADDASALGPDGRSADDAGMVGGSPLQDQPAGSTAGTVAPGTDGNLTGAPAAGAPGTGSPHATAGEDATPGAAQKIQEIRQKVQEQAKDRWNRPGADGQTPGDKFGHLRERVEGEVRTRMQNRRRGGDGASGQ